jgi:TPR repeat protein
MALKSTIHTHNTATWPTWPQLVVANAIVLCCSCSSTMMDSYTRECDAGRQRLCYILGKTYQSGGVIGGVVVPKDPSRAMLFYERACRLNDALSCEKAARIYEAGEGGPKDPTKAIPLYEQACNSGSCKACVRLAKFYRDGELVRKDLRRVMSLYGRTCSENCDLGCAALGEMYQQGEDVRQDIARAMSLYERACDAGSSEGCSDLAKLYEDGVWVRKDPVRAVSLYGRACQFGGVNECIRSYERDCGFGVVAGCEKLAEMYEAGDGVPKDPVRAGQYRATSVALYENACIGGDSTGCAKLAELDPVRATPYYEKACERGDAEVCEVLGRIYELGEGVPKSPTLAVQAYERACKGGRKRICDRLAKMYAVGEGIPKDPVRGMPYYEKACERGDGEMCEKLGKMYSVGDDVPRDLRKAVLFFKKAYETSRWSKFGGTGCGTLGLLPLFYCDSMAALNHCSDRARQCCLIREHGYFGSVTEFYNARGEVRETQAGPPNISTGTCVGTERIDKSVNEEIAREYCTGGRTDDLLDECGTLRRFIREGVVPGDSR